MRSVAIIQARMGSSRLPGKVLLDLAGQPMLGRVISRARLARAPEQVSVATTLDASDDPVAEYCAAQGVPCSRGSVHDVLDRYYQAAKAQQAEVVVRITADCPLVDPRLIDQVTGLVLDGADFACNRLPPPFSRSFPIGLDVEACRFSALERAWRESSETFHREHVMPYLYEGAQLAPDGALVSRGISPRGFSIAQLNHEPDYGALRWTVDTPEDLDFLREICARLPQEPAYPWEAVLEILEKEPGLAQINAGVRHKTMTEVDQRAFPPPQNPKTV